MTFRIANEHDIDNICDLISLAIKNMEKHHIFQWDSIYPKREDFMQDIQRGECFVGLSDNEISVVYTINQMCEKEYQNGNWKYPHYEYRIIHRLCVHPKFQNQGVAKTALLHIEDELRDMDVAAIRLDVFSNNPFALALYSHCGYEKVGVADWRKGRFYLMEKHL